ncbi:3-ketoacyl-ACP reductase [Saccharibacillus alkalitolerans]|uniref:3-ketoacyl-ACP reductase n=1 Tax=Saccharibacillus alkalitolerans TaxID=2705290 RepID=A0ABX0F9J1_9BACL|nr:3-ketoacyl-ACP reductase [Saccharibacillus alkalitolerans]NGZ76233.1 3-ketoacyl-ACP reductase [Saccharibacillus alkalitolerans]
MLELKNQTAVITGAGKGIGKAAAEALAAEGVHLGLIARTASDLESLKNELSEKYGVNVFVQAADVSVRTEIEAAVSALHEQLGAIDILINNAGIASFGKLAEMDPDEWERIIRVNLMGAYYTTRAALPFMLEQNSGSILNVASTAGERGFATGSAYCASKAALIGMSEALMQEVRKSNIRVMTLNPSTVNTELSVNNNLPIGDEDRMMQPEDVADLILATLKLPARVFVKSAGIWTTNPQ